MKRIAVRAAVAGVGAVAALALLSCSDSKSDRQAKPTFDWGYPEYSQYTASGAHVGTTLYQQDPECRQRLTFYSCDFVDAETPNDPTTNPTGASTEMTGGLDSCTAAIQETRPSYCIPADVCNPTKQLPAWAPGQASSDNLAWQLFIALNWPADPEQPGYPDTSSQPGAMDASGTQHAETVWLDYPTADELFGIPSPCAGPTLQMQSKLSDAFLSKSPPPGAFGGVVEPTGGVLIDQNGGVVHYDVRVNRTMWEFIVNQNDYWKTGVSLAALKPDLKRDYEVPPGRTRGAFPAARVYQGDERGDVGSMEVKTAWKILTSAEIASGTYFTRVFALDDPNGPVESRCRQTTMGLVGMHIVYQPALFGNPEWVWATFEHRANVPTAGINDGASEFSFYDPACTPVKTPAECDAYQPGVSSPAEFRCCPNLMLYADASTLPASPVPNQVVRATNPSVSTVLPTDCTGHYVAAIKRYFGEDNVWQNYFLVSTQWPLRGASTNFPAYKPEFEANFPCTLGNATLETFLVAHEAPQMNGCNASTQKPFCRACNGDCVATAAEAAASCPGGEETPDEFTTADCMGCHGTFAPQNSSFVFGHRPCCVRRDGFLPNVCGGITQRAACEANQACTWVSSDPACRS
jgi:hypothetical protein